MRSMTGWKCWWPKVTAPSITSSESSLASDSTINTPSWVPATTRSRSEFSISSICGLRTNSPSIRPTLAAAIGPMKGMPERVSAAEAPTRATMSGSFSRSWLTTVQITWVSL